MPTIVRMGDGEKSEVSVVVVGGGSAGCVLAARLSADPDRTVLVLEAGRDVRAVPDLPPVLPRLGHGEPRYEPADLWSYDVSLLDGDAPVARQYRGRVLGGSSAVNGSLFMRGVPEDYDSWGETWRFDRVLPYFRRTENDVDFDGEYHGRGGVFDVARGIGTPVGAFQEAFYGNALGLGVPEKPDLNHPSGEGIGYMPISNERNERTCASIAYLGRCRDRPNLTIRTGVLARRLVVERGRVVGVEAERDGRPFTVRAEEVVVSAGAFGSPGLLLRSGIGPAGELAGAGFQPVHDLPGVGTGMSCHPSVVLRQRTDQCTDDPESPRVCLVRTSASATAGERNDLTLFPRVVGGEATVLVTLRLPVSTGSVRLRSTDPDEPSAIGYGYLHPHDTARLRDGLALTHDILGRTPDGELSDAWIRTHLRTSDHACGTCRMGPAGDERAVVDEDCRVHGLAGLRVVDLSVVPRSVRAGPYATVIMLAERAADLMSSASSGRGT